MCFIPIKCESFQLDILVFIVSNLDPQKRESIVDSFRFLGDYLTQTMTFTVLYTSERKQNKLDKYYMRVQ